MLTRRSPRRARISQGITPPVRCGCLDYDLTEGDDYIMLLESMLSKQLLDPFDADTKRTVVSMICDAPVNPGDHLQVSNGIFHRGCAAIGSDLSRV